MSSSLVEKEGPITVVKRDGSTVEGCVDKIAERLSSLVDGLNTKFVDPASVAAKVYRGLYDGVSTVEIDELSAQCAASLTTVHPDYSLLAGRIAVSNLHKQTMVDSNHTFSDTVYSLRHYQLGDGRGASLIGDITYKVVEENKEVLNAAVDYSRDMAYDYFGFKTLERSYLLKIDGRIVERPQDMIMRVAVGIWGDDIESVLETYNMMSLKTFTHASPTLFNAGTPKPQCSSCFLVQMKDDSIEGIYDTLKTCALISKSAGGIGLSVHNIRASGTYIAGTNGTSNGLIPMLRVYNNTARYVDQGGNKRPGAFAIYLEPWHADIGDFLELKKNTGQEELRARDLFYGLWICDLFMKRVETNATWSLMCPRESPGLNECHGEEFEALYEKYEAEGRFKKQLPARELWNKILESQIETGTPYMMYKDACNRKSNQKNLGTISSSNLCTEIVEYTAPDEVAVCNLASISLPRFVDPETKTFDFDGLVKVTKRVAKNLDRVIDINFYPVPEARNSNMRHRPIGIGVQGLADTFALMRFPFDSPEARALNKDIFEAMYFAACTASHQLAVKDGAYSSFQGSPASKGELQFDLWGVSPSGKWDWDSLKADISRDGLRNSLLMAPMPTASTSQILGNNECFEPFTSNLYTRRVLAGTFQCVNKHLLRDLIDLGIWNDSLKEKIVARNGSVQGINAIPNSIQALYKTAWEMKQKVLIDMAADRGAFIDQSQSFSVFFNEASFAKLSSMHFYSWKIGLKTGMYYLRTRPAVDPVKISVSVDEAMAARAALTADAREKADEEAKAAIVCSLENKDACTMCSG